MAGSSRLENGRVRMTAHPAVEITAGGSPVTSLDLKDDTENERADRIEIRNAAIERYQARGSRGVRVKDSDSRTRSEFKGLENYPIDPEVANRRPLRALRAGQDIPITNVLSMTDDETSPGALVFDVGGTTYRIDPILEKGETDLFVIIC